MWKQDNDRIISGILTNDTIIVKAFYSKSLQQVTSYITMNSGSVDDAKDILQDAMVMIYEKIKSDTFSINCALSTYTYGICKYLWYNRLRKLGKQVSQEVLAPVEENISNSVEEKMINYEKKALVQKYFTKLDKSSQIVLSLYFEGFNTKEIAIRTNFTEAYVRKRKFMGKKQLLFLLEKDPLFKELKI